MMAFWDTSAVLALIYVEPRSGKTLAPLVSSLL